MATRKKATDEKPVMKQTPIRLTNANWHRIQLAKLTTGAPSVQGIMFEALQLWMKKNKLEALEPQGETTE